ncbi:bifunctional hydroxymethylpyrimidine kinase/phosphomethylpyrimidine kinase [Undibacterium fentianense]|uniref:hydroxymethylpyrimidine kinase n=1 Tax=Undibacterium fentianense TaxID=2828728 RepID=A0A941ID47_9BURK|nr:hydroxymethylpyrimidine/phosphomethylpyrimidine kinase [Undibacterium fentianense]MBR7800914.1 hydroxymethylpyrimidine/phosphomethylpyrimidine kinase [Undibacterium fentianense]
MRRDVQHLERPCVLVFAGHDPSGGAGIQADIEAIAAQGAHALPIITALTVQDNNQVYAVHPVAASLIDAQAQVLIANMPIDAIKLGIVGNRDNAETIARLIDQIQRHDRDRAQPIPVVLDPVLASGHGNRLSAEDASFAMSPLLGRATLITPNLPELTKLAPHGLSITQQARALLGGDCSDVLVKGGHGHEALVINRWFSTNPLQAEMEWSWPRYTGGFHGSGCTLAAAISGLLAMGLPMASALLHAQEFTQQSLQHAYKIAPGQMIPLRSVTQGRK